MHDASPQPTGNNTVRVVIRHGTIDGVGRVQ
jgi:hypothetical protein